jgi:[acyl-carrier-protein] S-malonyltransferase
VTAGVRAASARCAHGREGSEVVIACIFPGQGSQQVGMAKALCASFAEAREAMEEAEPAFASAGGGPSLRTLMWEGPEAQLMLTEHAQPALVAASVAAWRVLAAQGVAPAFAAGHSLGEYSAHVAAGTFGLADAVATVRRRGRYMQEAVPVGSGAMAAVLGADLAIVRQACEEAAEGDVVSPANINAPGQVVIAGTVAAVARAAARARALGARRVVPLAVSAPFHCALMEPAAARLEPDLHDIDARAPRVPVVANVDAQPKREAWAAIDALVRQVAAPVQWHETIRRLASEGVTTYVEVGPGTVLSGLVRKIQPDARVVAFGSPDDLDAVGAACSISAAR